MGVANASEPAALISSVVAAAPAGAKIAPFGKEDTAKELQQHAARTQDTLVDAVENAEVAEIKRAVFRALTRLRAAEIKEFDTIARLETQAIDEYNDAHHYRAENPLAYIHSDEPKVSEDKYPPSTEGAGVRHEGETLCLYHTACPGGTAIDAWTSK